MPNQLYFWQVSDFKKINHITLDDYITDFSLSMDGAYAAIINGNGKNKRLQILTLYHISTGNQVSFSIDSKVVSVAFCGDELALGKRFDGKSNRIDVYDNKFTTLITQMEMPLAIMTTEFALQLKYHGPTNLLASAGTGAILWDMEAKKVIWNYFDIIKSDKKDLVNWPEDIWESTCISFSPSGEYLAIGHWGNHDPNSEKVYLYSISKQQVLGWCCPWGHAIDDVAISPNDQLIAGTGPSQFARIWDIETGALWAECELEGMSALTFSPDGKFFVTGADSPNSLVFWELS
ncbi:MAG: WD40 repeat domain-containing protein [Chloroflexota bacterium]